MACLTSGGRDFITVPKICRWRYSTTSMGSSAPCAPPQQPHRHQAPAVGQRPHVALQVRSPDEVDHHIHAPALRGLRHHRLKVFAAAVDEHIGPAVQHGAATIPPALLAVRSSLLVRKGLAAGIGLGEMLV